MKFLLPPVDFVCVMFLCIMSSCSVKEDREACPCRLSFDLSEVSPTAFDSLKVRLVSADGFGYSGRIGQEHFGGCYEIAVPRSSLAVNLYTADKGLCDEGMIAIPYGQECPPVFFCMDRIEPDHEKLEYKVILRKNYCMLTVVFLYPESPVPYTLAVTGNICGYDADGSPAEGRFKVIPDIEDSGYSQLCLPRQKDTSLILEIYDAEGEVRKFSLGEYIAESGYDWSAPDLEDLEIQIDYAIAYISFKVEDWEKTIAFDVVI